MAEYLDKLLQYQKLLIRDKNIDLDLIRATWLPILEERSETPDDYNPNNEDEYDIEPVSPDHKLEEGEEFVEIDKPDFYIADEISILLDKSIKK